MWTVRFTDELGKTRAEARVGRPALILAIFLALVVIAADAFLLGRVDGSVASRTAGDVNLRETRVRTEQLSAAVGTVLDLFELLPSVGLRSAAGEPDSDSGSPLRVDAGHDSAAGQPQSAAELARATAVLRQYTADLTSTTAAYDGLLRVLGTIPNLWPIQGGLGTVSFEFGPAIHPFTKSWYLHRGIDISARPGVRVLSMASGRVSRVERDTTNFGLQVVVDHEYGFQTRYAHLDSALVTRGDVVEPGDSIGTIGSSGLVTGPALHLEIMIGGELVDPATFLTMTTAFARKTRVRK